MTSQSILTMAPFGQGWVPASGRIPSRSISSFRRSEPYSFDPKSLQERNLPETPTSEEDRESGHADKQLDAATLQTLGAGRIAELPARRQAPTLGETARIVLGENGVGRFRDFM